MSTHNKIKVMTIFGTRPEAIKMAPVVLELKKYPKQIETITLVTAQHRQMLDQVLDLFCIKPDYDLNIMSDRQTLFDITCRALDGLKDIISKENPDLILVHGDTTTTFVGALAAFYNKISLGHVEAGLRTENKYSPFPEEMNRKLTGVLTDYHFAPTETTKENLLRENVKENQVFITGNTVIDALKATIKEDYMFEEEVLKNIDYDAKKVILVTAHRRENLGEPLRQICQALLDVLDDAQDDVHVIFPVHKNPLVREIVDKELKGKANITLIEPLDYEPFANLMARSYLVLTDSGGVQEEAPSLGKPVLVLRDTTERPEALLAGTVRLVGSKRTRVYLETKRLLENREEYLKMANAVNPYGDGKAACRIVKTILFKYGFIDEPAVEFKN